MALSIVGDLTTVEPDANVNADVAEVARGLVLCSEDVVLVLSEESLDRRCFLRLIEVLDCLDEAEPVSDAATP